MSSRYKPFSYEITTDPEFLNKKSGITPELFRQMEDLLRRALRGGDKNIQKLISLIEHYPQVVKLRSPALRDLQVMQVEETHPPPLPRGEPEGPVLGLQSSVSLPSYLRFLP